MKIIITKRKYRLVRNPARAIKRNERELTGIGESEQPAGPMRRRLHGIDGAAAAILAKTIDIWARRRRRIGASHHHRCQLCALELRIPASRQ